MASATVSSLPLATKPITAPASPPDSSRDRWLVALITFVATIARLHGITTNSFWLDEGFSVKFARMAWPRLANTLAHGELNMSLYYVLLHFWLKAGSSEAFIRGLSLIFSVATIPFVYLLGKRLFGRDAGLMAAWLLSINAYHVRYAHEARSYALLVFLATVATCIFVRNLQEPGRAQWAWYTALCSLTVYAHFYGGLIVLAHVASLAFLPPERIPWRKLLRCYAAFAALIAPIAVLILPDGSARLSWVPPLQANSLLRLGIYLSGNFGRELLAVDSMAIAVLLWSSSRGSVAAARSIETWPIAMVGSWLCVPLAIVFAASLIRPLFVPRYLIFCLPALMILVAAGIARVQPVALSVALLAAISIGSVLGTLSYYKRDFDSADEDWRAAAAYISGHAQPGDRVFFYPSSAEVPYDFYMQLKPSAANRPQSLNPEDDSNPLDTDSLVIPGSEIRSLPFSGDRVWLILYFVADSNGALDTRGAAARDWLWKGRTRVEVKRFPPISIVLFARQSADGPQSSLLVPQPGR